jgi:hypothetical protein
MIDRATVQKALNAISKRRADYEYFFSRLDTPAWIAPLRDSGLFKHPPPNENEGNYVRFPAWPESQYLARVAATAPDEVMQVFLDMDRTDNPRVHEDAIDAALAVPGLLAERIVATACEWVKRPYLLRLPRSLNKFLHKLIVEERPSAALVLAKSLLALRPKPGTDEEDGSFSWRTPKPYIDDFAYQQILRDRASELVGLTGLDGFRVLCDALRSYVELDYSKKDYSGPVDMSHIHRPAIEDREENRLYNSLDALIIAVRDTAAQLEGYLEIGIDAIVDELVSRNWHVFTRIALYRLSVTDIDSNELATAMLLDREAFDTPGLRHEYTLLLIRYFQRLSPQQQKVILGWIDDQDVDGMRAFLEGRGELPSNEQLVALADEERLKRLVPISDQLSGQWRQRYDDLARRYPAPDHPEFTSVISTGWVGPTSPLSDDEISRMGPAELLEYLSAWTPPGGSMAPCRAGLGRGLERVVADNPAKYDLLDAGSIPDEPTYVRAILAGFRQSVDKAEPFDWARVMLLCGWAVGQANTGKPGKAVASFEDDWDAVHQEVAALVERGLSANEMRVPFGLRPAVWDLIHALVDSPAERSGLDSSSAEGGLDAATESLNTTHGRAMHAVVRYALWVQKNLGERSGAEPETFEPMPEVEDVLDRHLDLGLDASVAVRSVYGQWLPWLAVLDRDWTSDNLTNIFPRATEHSPYWDAAWRSYISFCHPYDNVFQIAADEYRQAIQSLDLSHEEEGRGHVAHERLAEHLVIYYCRATPGPVAELLRQFFERADETLRAHAITFACQALGQGDRTAPADAIKRAMNLWESRLAALQSSLKSDKDNAELAAFGWWFASEVFDAKWSLRQLREILDLGARLGHVIGVFERLAGLAAKYPADVVDCLELLVRSGTTHEDIFMNRTGIFASLEQLLQSGNAGIVDKAEAIVNQLLATGEFSYGGLLNRRGHALDGRHAD